MLSKETSYAADASTKKTVDFLISQIKDNDEMALPDEIEIKSTSFNKKSMNLVLILLQDTVHSMDIKKRFFVLQ